jgi:hypothetical protein
MSDTDTYRPFPEGWLVTRKSDGAQGYVANAWRQDDGTELIFVSNLYGTDYLSVGIMGESVTKYTGNPVHAPDIERKAGRRYRGILPSFSSLGAYPLIYITRGCEVLCAGCATEQIDAGNDTNDDPVIEVDVYYEGAGEYCANCNRLIASAYGDPDAPACPACGSKEADCAPDCTEVPARTATEESDDNA